MTPAMASEPYTAEAPPVMISTFSISEVEIELRSMAPSASEGCIRRPSSRISVRWMPRPRRLALLRPWRAGLLEALALVAENCGIWLKVASRVCGPASSTASAETLTIGLSAV